MSDDVKLPNGKYVPIQDTICECVHWYDEHNDGQECQAPNCVCAGFVASPQLSTAAAIADRGGDPAAWPEHVRRAARGNEGGENDGDERVAKQLLNAYGVDVTIYPSEVTPGRITVEIDTDRLEDEQDGPPVNLYLNDHRCHPA